MVVELVPCPVIGGVCPTQDDKRWVARCNGCIGNGRRVDLSNGIPVEKKTVDRYYTFGAYEYPASDELDVFVPVEVSDLKEPSDG
jgi:hypothetical protein